MSIDCFCPGHENYFECPVNYYECNPNYPVPAIVYDKGKISEVRMGEESLSLPIPEFFDRVDYLIGRMRPNYPVPAIVYVADVTNYDDFIPLYD